MAKTKDEQEQARIYLATLTPKKSEVLAAIDGDAASLITHAGAYLTARLAAEKV